MANDFAPAIDDAVRMYEARFGTRLCAIYLSGSLAYGDGLFQAILERIRRLKPPSAVFK